MDSIKIRIDLFLETLLDMDKSFKIQNLKTKEVYLKAEFRDHLFDGSELDYLISKEGTTGKTVFCFNQKNQEVNMETFSGWFPLSDFGYSKSEFLDIFRKISPQWLI